MYSTLRNLEVQPHEVNTGRKQGGKARQGSQDGRARVGRVDTASCASSLLSLLSRGSQLPTPSCMNCGLQSPQAYQSAGYTPIVRCVRFVKQPKSRANTGRVAINWAHCNSLSERRAWCWGQEAGCWGHEVGCWGSGGGMLGVRQDRGEFFFEGRRKRACDQEKRTGLTC